MPNPATTQDLADRWRPLLASEEGPAQFLLDDIWIEIVAKLPTIDLRLANGTLDPNLVVRVMTAVALRVLRNPDGKRQETIDDYSWTRDNLVASGQLAMTGEEIALLAGRANKRAFAIEMWN